MLEDRRLLSGGHDVLDIGDTGDNSVKQFDARTGAYLGTLVAPGGGGLDGPRALILRNNGQLLVVNQNIDLPSNGEIDRYNAKTGAFLGALVAASDPNAPFAPRGMVVKGNIVYVANLQDNTDSTANGEIKEYRAGTGQFLGDLFPTGLPGKFNPKSLVFGPDGGLYVSSFDTANPLVGDILKFNTTTGSYKVMAFNNGDGVADPGETQDLHRPEGLAFGPGGNLYVTSFRADASDTDRILVLNGTTGQLQGEINLDSVGGDRAFAEAIIFGPGGHLFVPISGNGPDTGGVRRYDVTADTYTDFVAPGGPLGSPWYLSFGETDPATLAYDAIAHGDSLSVAAPGGRAEALAQISGLDPLVVGANVDPSLARLDLLHPLRRRAVR
jgi:outer membrane protein assembly factor BamB